MADISRSRILGASIDEYTPELAKAGGIVPLARFFPRIRKAYLIGGARKASLRPL
jgi:hypothetical protein